MAKYIRTDVQTGDTVKSDVNVQLELIETAINDSLSRKGDVPNAMEADLDMNDNDILNANEITTSSLVLGGIQATASLSGVDLIADYLWTGTHSFSIGLLPTDLDLTAAYDWTGEHSFAAVTTFSADIVTSDIQNTTRLGVSSLPVVSGINNTAIGFQAGNTVTTGAANVFVGKNAGQRALTMDDCVVIGVDAGRDLDGDDNTLVGDASGTAITTGTNNTALGSQTLKANLVGVNNTAIGTAALTNCTGSNNTVVGGSAGDSIVGGEENTLIGFNCEVSDASATNQIVIGNTVSGLNDYTFSFGAIEGGGGIVRNAFSTDALWARDSDERKKENITDSEFGLELISQLRPVEFTWKEGFGQTGVRITGLIAQEVEAAVDGRDFIGHEVQADGFQVLKLEAFIMPLINSIKELEARIIELEAK